MKHSLISIAVLGLLTTACQTTQVLGHASSMMTAAQQSQAAGNTQSTAPTNLQASTTNVVATTVDASLTCDQLKLQMDELDLNLAENRKAAGITGSDIALGAAGSAATYEAARSGLLGQNPNVGRAMNMLGSMNKKRKEKRRKEAFAAVQEGELIKTALTQRWTEKNCTAATTAAPVEAVAKN